MFLCGALSFNEKCISVGLGRLGSFPYLLSCDKMSFNLDSIYCLSSCRVLHCTTGCTSPLWAVAQSSAQVLARMALYALSL